MKKIVLLLSVAFLIFSCSDDDDNSSSAEDLVGTWVSTQSFEDDVAEPLDKCDLMDTITITDTEYSIVTFYDMDGECVEDDTFTTSYTATSSAITLKGDEDAEYEEDQEDEVFNYSISGSTLTFSGEFETEVEDENGGYVKDEDGEFVLETVTFRQVFTRQ